MYEDAIGRPIKPGDVIIKFSRVRSSIRSQVGIVRELLDGGYVRWQFVTDHWKKDATLNKPSTFWHTDLCIILPLTEGGLREKYHIAEE